MAWGPSNQQRKWQKSSGLKCKTREMRDQNKIKLLGDQGNYKEDDKIYGI